MLSPTKGFAFQHRGRHNHLADQTPAAKYELDMATASNPNFGFIEVTSGRHYTLFILSWSEDKGTFLIESLIKKC